MKAVLGVAAAVVVGLMAAVTPMGPVERAQACSCGDCDFVTDADLVVRGTVTGWDYQQDAGGDPIEREVEGQNYGESYQPMERPIRMTLAVDAVHKGAAPRTVTFMTAQYDRYLRAEGAPKFDEWQWPLESGRCFGLEDDPTGIPLLFLLYQTPDGFELRTQPYPLNEGDILQRYPNLAPPYPPSVGKSPVLASEPASDWLWLSAIGGGLVLLTLVLLLIGPRDDRRGR